MTLHIIRPTLTIEVNFHHEEVLTMRKDAHYYAILAFCRACRFDKTTSYEIAYASQFVDDSKTNTITLDEDDIIDTISVQTRRPRRDLFNAVKGVFVDPQQHYQPADSSGRSLGSESGSCDRRHIRPELRSGY